jgi:hypothetical protein
VEIAARREQLPRQHLRDLARTRERGMLYGYLEQYFQAVEPGHADYLTNNWLYDTPSMLNTAIRQGLTDDQWGMIKELGFPVGPWYLIVPTIIHVKLPGGSFG